MDPNLIPHSYTLFTPPLDTAPRIAREFVASVLRSLGLDHLTEAARLCTSELVTNVCRHAADVGALLWLAVDPGFIRVSVYDGSPGVPILRTPGTAAETGRGLLLVTNLADKWGVELGCPLGLGDTGKGIWFELYGQLPPVG
jgi:anti-sigma regulatory factor (Ser/Thr protein kinase)